MDNGEGGQGDGINDSIYTEVLMKTIEKYVTDKNALTIPMVEGQRSLNLSNSVAIVAYEVIRQNGI